MSKSSDDDDWEEVYSVLVAAVERLNRIPSLSKRLKKWNATTVFRFKSSKPLPSLSISVADGKLTVSKEIPQQHNALEVIVEPGTLMDICKGSVSVIKAISQGELEILHASLTDVMRFEALIGLLRPQAQPDLRLDLHPRRRIA
jgi:putative sterol carrier protein